MGVLIELFKYSVRGILMKNQNLVVLIILSLVMLLLAPLGSAIPANAADAADNSYLQEMMHFIKDRYYFEVNEEQITQGALKGMFQGLDDYSDFFTREEAQVMLESVEGNYEGIGVALSKVDNYIVITRVFPSSPAESAGLLSGDRLVTVDKKDVLGYSVEKVSTLIRGPKDSLVNLGIVRNGIKNVVEFRVKREDIKLNPVRYENRGGIGYIAIDSFNSNTAEFLVTVLEAAEKDGISKLVLDLRDNTGGEVTQAVAVARHFVPAGPITTIKFKAAGMKDKVYTSELSAPPYKLVVLVNGMTASASEIVAGAIQDSQAGVLLGSKTYGKARVQAIIPLLSPEAYQKYARLYPDTSLDSNEMLIHHGIQATDREIMGWAKITTGIYTTPSGKYIDGQGLLPDIKVSDPTPLNGWEISNLMPLEKSGKPALNSSSLEVYNAEKILSASGYELDKPDMTLDIKTFNAIKKFQQEQRLYPSGILDFTTQEALNRKRQELINCYDQQYARAVEYLLGR